MQNQEELIQIKKDKKSQYQKKYYEENKAKIAKSKSQIFNCECGGSCVIQQKARHIKGWVHQQKMIKILEDEKSIEVKSILYSA